MIFSFVVKVGNRQSGKGVEELIPLAVASAINLPLQFVALHSSWGSIGTPLPLCNTTCGCQGHKFFSRTTWKIHGLAEHKGCQ
jgi:hypothetical protein